MVKNPPANAGDMGLIPVPGKMPHALGQLSPCTPSTEPVRSGAQEKPLQSGAPTHHSYRKPIPSNED